MVGIVAGAASVAAAAPEHGATRVTREARVDDDQVARPRGGTTATEVIELTVVGTVLALASDPAPRVELRSTGNGSKLRGVLPPVRVIDARGTLTGWQVEWATTDEDVVLDPDAPVVVAGVADGLVRGRAARATAAPRIVFGACAGSGGGTYEGGATVTADRSADAGDGEVTLELRVVPTAPDGC
jgi:hypothetical protein